MTTLDSVRQIILRDIRALERQIDAYGDEDQLWVKPNGIRNSAGNLVLHLGGNLRHFIGHGLGRSGYVRNREFEFESRDVPRDELKRVIADTGREVSAALDGLADDALGGLYPTPPAGRTMSTGLFLMHLSAHLGYHLGQIDYHRRMVTGNSDGINAVSVLEIGE